MPDDDLRLVMEYQQKLYESLQELSNSHRAVHMHVRHLTEAHNAVREDTNGLLKAKADISTLLRELHDAHRETREQVHQVIEAINYIQQQIRRMELFEERLSRLEHA